MRCLVTVALLTLAGCDAPPSRPVAEPDAAVAQQLTGTDHHVHLLGPDLIRDWKALGIPFTRPDSVYLRPDRYLSQVDRIVLVSMGHAYGDPELLTALDISPDEAEARVRRENDHLVAAATRLAPRARAFCSAPLLAAYARAELERCIAAGGRGIKLHLAASRIDLRDPADVAAVEAILGWAESAGLPVLLHLDTQRRGTEAEHVRGFLHAALAPHPAVTVIVAHLGGSGGYGAWTQAVFRTIAEWTRSEGRNAHLYMDVSAVLLEEGSEGIPASTPDEVTALEQDLRAYGLSRIVYGSDAPSFGPRRYADLLVARRVFSRHEMESVLRNSPLGDSSLRAPQP